jgi:hypothetical protein
MNAADSLSTDYYSEHFSRLTSAGEVLYDLTPSEAEALAHNILLASLQQKTRISDPYAWFAAALKCAVERRRGRG